MKSLVFVYGTLKKGQGNHRLLTGAEYIGKDSLKNHVIYSLGGFPGMTVGDGQVQGEVYEVDEVILGALDILEGHPRFYERREVTTDDNRKAWTYYYHHPVKKIHLIQSGVW